MRKFIISILMGQKTSGAVANNYVIKAIQIDSTEKTAKCYKLVTSYQTLSRMDNEAILVELAKELKSRSTARIALESGIYILIAIVIIIGNTMTLYIVYKNRHFRTVPNLFIISLAISDLGIALLSMPMGFTGLAISHWPYSNTACQYSGFIGITMVAASIQSMAWTSVSRYFKVVKPHKYRRYFTMKLTSIYIAAFWIVSAFATPPYWFAGKRMFFHPGKFVCFLKMDATWYTGTVPLYIGLPTSITLYCYMRVFQTVNKHNKQFAKSRANNNSNNLSVEEIKITRTLFVVLLVYMTCWTPILIIDLIDTFRGYWSMSRDVYTFYSFLGVVSSATNPIIYGVMNPQFKKEYLKIVCCKAFRCRCKRDSKVESTNEIAAGPSSQDKRSSDSHQQPTIQHCDKQRKVEESNEEPEQINIVTNSQRDQQQTEIMHLERISSEEEFQ